MKSRISDSTELSGGKRASNPRKTPVATAAGAHMAPGRALSLLSALVAVLLSFTLSACSRSEAHEHGEDEAHEHLEAAATYKQGFGVQLSREAAQVIDLAIGDVEARGIPTSALLRTVKGDFVYVANGEWFLRTPVKVGATDGDWLAVQGGLYEGDRVVTRGARALWLAELQAVNGGVGCADGH